MPGVVRASFEYSFADLRGSFKQHLNSPLRRIYRVLATTVAAALWIGVICVSYLYEWAHHSFSVDIYTAFFFLLLLSFLTVLQYASVNALLVKRRFKHMFGERHSWEFSDDGYSVVVGERSQGSGKWLNFTKVISTPAGVLLYHPNRLFNWVPTRAFSGPEDLNLLVEMAKKHNVKIVVRK